MQIEQWCEVSGVMAAGVVIAFLGMAVPARATTLVDFDNVTAPCGWSDGVVALRDEYAPVRVLFDGSGPDDGGGVIDECGNFGVTGHSPPNFLGFNRAAQFNYGGRPIPPETMNFNPPVHGVSIGVGSSETGSAWMGAFDSGGVLVDTDVVALSTAVQPMWVSGADIVRVVIDTDVDVFILDDLVFGDRPTLELSGTCPGPVTVHLRDFQPGGSVGVLTGTGLGSDVLQGGPCAGVSTGLAGLGRVGVVTVNNQGSQVLQPNVGAGYCQDWFQAVDLTTCLLSPLVRMP